MCRASTRLVLFLLICHVESPQSNCDHASRLTVYDQKLSFCDAHSKCFEAAKIKGLFGFMRGRCIGRYLAADTQAEAMWINVHALMHREPTVTDSEWVYGESNEPRSDEDVELYPVHRTSDYTDGYRVTVVDAQNRLIRYTTVSSLADAVACQETESIDSKRKMRKEKFMGVRLKRNETWFAKANFSVGCFKRDWSSTAMNCVLKCHLDLKCRSCYFNQENNACVLTQFVDSLMNKTNGNEVLLAWQRFARPSWKLDNRN
ncbi:hypothetical protein FGIG_05739 [Fasciola gigantica]|uniref:Apple domain-containing protein n=1 Tax=Fasciola gigantica TaxID=46835 RepID=A0A504YT33_FASGI|nr:hypothetical protein FGIG_05739 [Fasciola gigantica]